MFYKSIVLIWNERTRKSINENLAQEYQQTKPYKPKKLAFELPLSSAIALTIKFGGITN